MLRARLALECVEKIIGKAISLQRTGRTGAFTGEIIATTFVLDRQDFIPSGYTMFEAWERTKNGKVTS